MTAATPLSTDNSTASLIDREHLSVMTGGDAELAKEIIEIFREQADIWARMLDTDNPPQQWADAAHALKGAALSLGANSLASACATAETLGRRADPPSKTEAAVALSDIKDALGAALEAAAHLGHEIAQAGKL